MFLVVRKQVFLGALVVLLLVVGAILWLWLWFTAPAPPANRFGRGGYRSLSGALPRSGAGRGAVG